MITKQDFIQHVLHILNEAGSINGAEMVGADMTQLPLYIEKLYPGAWRRAVKILPCTWFETKSFSDAEKITNAPDGTGYIILPSDYLQLSSFKMTGWKTNVLTSPEQTPTINAKQANEYTRGTIQRPICVLRLVSHENALKQALYYYSLPRRADDETHTIEHALYIPNVTELASDVNIGEQLAEPLAYICASAVLTSFEKDTAAKAIEAELLKMI
jgi:hypothetical protein